MESSDDDDDDDVVFDVVDDVDDDVDDVDVDDVIAIDDNANIMNNIYILKDIITLSISTNQNNYNKYALNVVVVLL